MIAPAGTVPALRAVPLDFGVRVSVTFPAFEVVTILMTPVSVATDTELTLVVAGGADQP